VLAKHLNCRDATVGREDYIVAPFQSSGDALSHGFLVIHDQDSFAVALGYLPKWAPGEVLRKDLVLEAGGLHERLGLKAAEQESLFAELKS
jgi:hypothetical protein